jgi:hypothetical protein
MMASDESSPPSILDHSNLGLGFPDAVHSISTLEYSDSSTKFGLIVTSGSSGYCCGARGIEMLRKYSQCEYKNETYFDDFPTHFLYIFLSECLHYNLKIYFFSLNLN